MKFSTSALSTSGVPYAVAGGAAMGRVKAGVGVIVVILVLALGYVGYSLLPRHIALVLQGVQIQVDSVHNSREVHLALTGTLYPSLFGPRTFVGKIDLSGTSIANPYNGKDLTVKFDEASGGDMVYVNWQPLETFAYGVLFANEDFSRFAILEFRPSPNGGGWTTQNGLVIAAPARTAQQAFTLSNALAHAYLGGYRLNG